MKLNTPEQNLLQACLDYLTLQKIAAVHHKTTGKIIVREGKYIFGGRTRQDQKGAPDILFTYLGRGCAWELKSPIGRMRPEQKTWAQWFIAAPNHGIHFLIRSLDDAENALEFVRRISKK